MTDKTEPQGEMSEITGEMCAFCHEKKLTLREMERDIPYFGHVFIFSMDCDGCGYHKADVEAAESHGPIKYTLEIDSEEDMKIRIIKSSTATVKIPHVGSIDPGEASNGYVTNVEGILNRLKKQVEFLRNESEDKADIKKAKNIIKKLTKVMWGQEKLKLILEDPVGNSGIISDKAVKGKL
ncbi:MAG: ZPR1 zinc finger domain-containing protein [archaeon]